MPADWPAAPAGRARGWFVVDELSFRARGVWLLLAFAAMAVTVGLRLVDVQLRQGPRLATLAAQQHADEVTLHAHRGRILDRAGNLIASDLAVYSVFADPGVISPDARRDYAVTLAPILRIGTAQLEEELGGSGRFVYLAHAVSEQTRRELQQANLYGIGTLNEDHRIYASSPVAGSSLAANLVGFVDHDGHGQYGIEAYYDAVLRGRDGIETTLRDLRGNPIVLGQAEHQDARDGRDLRLGLDSSVQLWAEQALAQGVTDAQAESGTVLVMDTHSGAIRAWADYPTYDANQFTDSDVGRFRDLGIQALYEPGSVMKVVTFAGALDAHVITPQATFDESQQVIDGYLIHDWDNRSHGRITYQWVLDNSLNNGAIHVMQLMGKDAYYRNLLTFGIGAPTGVDLAGEVSQPLRPQAIWSDVDYATASFGQQVSVTPVEMLAAVNAVANGGTWVQPHAVEAIVDPQSGQETAFSPAQRPVMSPAAAATLAQMMSGVVEDRGASGYLARIAAFKGQIGGKTGTASVPVNGHYGDDVNVSFVGFLPEHDPQFTMLVLLRKPHHCTPHCEGAYVAAPIFKQLAQLMIDAWKIVPSGIPQ